MKEMIVGGARSGKSTLAERRARESGLPVTYIATAQALDGEMTRRIALHRARRPASWGLLEAPLALPAAIREHAAPGHCLLVDCLTLWLTNLMLGGHDWRAAGRALIAALPEQRAPVVFVTNELGAGIVPENRLAREFRDAAGLLNQWVAAAAEEVTLAVCGLPLKVK